MKYIILLTIFSLNNTFGQEKESIYEKINLAESYLDAGFADDAIDVYKNIFVLQKNILGENNIELVNTLHTLSDIYLEINAIDSAKVYLKKALDIQYYNFLHKQKKYTTTYEKLKNIFLYDNDSTKVSQIDSMLNILNDLDNQFQYIKSDSLLVFPEIISLRPAFIDSTNLVSEYSLNDRAIEMIDYGLSLINAGLFSESIKVFDNAIKLKANIIDLDYLQKIEFGDSLNIKNLINTYNEAESIDSTINTQHLFNAILYDKIGKNKKEIIASLLKHITLFNDDIKGYEYLGKLYFENGQYLDAIHYYHRILLINPKYISANMKLAKCLIYFEDYKMAIEKLSLIIELDENNFEAKYYLGYCLFHLNNYNEAIKEFTHALLLNSNDALTYYYLGKSYILINKKKQALEAFIMSSDLNPFDGNTHFELGKIYESILKTNLAIEKYKLADKYIDNHELNYIYGTLLYNEQLYREAIRPLREYIIFEENNTEVLEMLGDIFIKENRYPESIDTYNRLVEQYPDNENFYENIAYSYNQLNNYNMAKKYYEKVLLFDEENANILFQLGSISNLLYQYKEAEEYLTESISCSYASKDLLFELGLSYGGQKKYLQASMALKEAINFSLDDPILHYQLGAIYQEMFIFDLAIQEYRIYLETYRNDPIAYRLIGDSYVNLNNYQDAIINYRKAAELYNYEDLLSLYKLGESYFNIEDYNNAAKYFKSALKINYDHAQTHAYLASTYTILKKYREAKKECDILYMLDRESYNNIDYCIN